MTRSLRVLGLLAAAIGGLTAAPTIAADGTLARQAPVVALSESQDWALRPTKATAAAIPSGTHGSQPAVLSKLPDARRSVRVVYQGYLEAGPLRTSR